MKNILILTVLVTLACQDLARPALERCRADEAAGKIEEALQECEEAVGLAKDSESGKEAAAMAELLRPAATKAKTERLAREAEAKKVAAEEAKKAAEKRRLELLSKVERRFFSADRDSDCTGRGLPPYRWEYSGGTFAEDAELAALDGCGSPYSYQGNTTFCCPRAPSPWGF